MTDDRKRQIERYNARLPDEPVQMWHRMGGFGTIRCDLDEPSPTILTHPSDWFWQIRKDKVAIWMTFTSGFNADKRHNMALEPCPTLCAAPGGLAGATCYWLENDGKPPTREEIKKMSEVKPPYRIPLMTEIARVPKNGYKVASTFSGCGGSCLGYRWAGYQVVWANEFIPAAQESYKANHPDSILDPRDIKKISPQEILDAIGMGPGELDIFDGSPPCQAFSTAGKGAKGWGKGKTYENGETQLNETLFFTYAEIVRHLQPKVFIAENVRGLTIGACKDLMGDAQQDMFDDQSHTILHTLMDCGYAVDWRLMNAVNFGTPQNRQRVIFMGIRKDLFRKHRLAHPWPMPLPYVYTVRDAIPWIARVIQDPKGQFAVQDLDASEQPSFSITCRNGSHCTVEAEPGSGERTGAPPPRKRSAGGPPPRNAKVEPESDISRYATGAEWDKLKPGEQSQKYFSEVKVDPDGPSPTICASHGSPGIASPVHPFEKRKFSIFEVKRLGGFPDDYVLTGNYQQQWERIGNSVAPPFMMRIATAIRRSVLDVIKRETKP